MEQRSASTALCGRSTTQRSPHRKLSAPSGRSVRAVVTSCACSMAWWAHVSGAMRRVTQRGRPSHVSRERRQAKRRKCEVVIHRANGQIRDKDSYGADRPEVIDTKH